MLGERFISCPTEGKVSPLDFLPCSHTDRVWVPEVVGVAAKLSERKRPGPGFTTPPAFIARRKVYQQRENSLNQREEYVFRPRRSAGFLRTWKKTAASGLGPPWYQRQTFPCVKLAHQKSNSGTATHHPNPQNLPRWGHQRCKWQFFVKNPTILYQRPETTTITGYELQLWMKSG